MNGIVYVPEEDLAWVAYLICHALSHDKKRFWHEYPDYSRREAHSLGISTKCLREMRML